MKYILLLNGPNLNLLGERSPEIYGTATLRDVVRMVSDRAADLGIRLRDYQSNHEGELIDRIHTDRAWMEGLIFNPGAFTHYSYALRDAVEAVRKPMVEVHLSDLSKREEFRRFSVFDGLPMVTRVMGKGTAGYLEALEHLASLPSTGNH